MSPLPKFLHPGNHDSAPLLMQHSRQGTYLQHVLVLTPQLRTSGLLATLTEKQLQVLVALLTFQSASGTIQASASAIAEVLGQHQDTVLVTLSQLEKTLWQDTSVVYTVQGQYHPSKQLVAPQAIPDAPPEPPRPKWPMASREQVVQHSRATYGRPIEEVEREISRQLAPVGLESLGESEREAALLLIREGVPTDQAKLVVASVLPEEIRQQIAWLPYRQAKNPARYLVAACLDHYAPPRGVELPTIQTAPDLPPFVVEESRP